MTISELLNDLTARFLEVEKNHYPKIKSLKGQINSINSNYEIMKEKHGVIIQNIVLILIPIVFICIFPDILKNNQEFFEEIRNNFISFTLALILAVIIFVFPIIAPILNFFRSRLKYKRQLKKADEWWEQTGKKQIVELNNSINNINGQAYDFLNINPLYERLKNTEFCNSEDCYEMYLIAKSYQYNSFEEVLSFFYQEKIKEYEREEADRKHREILEAIEEATEESVRLRKEMESQGRRADFDRSILELQLSEIRHRNS